MNDTDRDRFADHLEGLGLTFDKEVTDALTEIYFRALGDLPIETVIRSITSAIRTCIHFPRPAELRELVEGAVEDAAFTAWTRLMEAYRRVGEGSSLLFEDGAIVEAMNRVFGGWAQLCRDMHPVFVAENHSSIEDREQMLKERRNPDENARMIQVGGLSPEMIRARQKEFYTAYRQAVREGKGRQPQYVRGFHESNNRQGRFNRGVPELIEGRKVIRQPVYVQGATGRMVDAEFDFFTWELLTPIGELLSRPAQKLLPPKIKQKLLPGEVEFTMDPDQARLFFKDAVSALAQGMRMPTPRKGLTEEEWEANRARLQLQISKLEEPT